MNRLFKQIPLPLKLIAIGLIPLIVLIILAFQIYNEKNEKIAMIDGYLRRIQQTAKLSRLVDDLQSERRYSFGYVLKKDWRTEMIMQRARTDSSLSAIRADEQGRLKGFESYTFLKELKAYRNAIDNGSIKMEDVLTYYSNTIYRLNTFNNVAAGNVVYLQSANQDLVSQKLLLEMITNLGILRANIYYALYSNNPAAASAASIGSVFNIYNSYAEEFTVKATPAILRQYKTIAETTDLRTTNAYIRSVIETNILLPTYDAERWWQISANGVDELKKLQRQVLLTAEEKVSRIDEQEVTKRNITIAILAAVIILVIIIIAYVVRSITTLMSELKDAANKIARGDTDIEIDIRSRDAIGSLAQSMILIDRNNHALTRAANQIGQGNFDVDVYPRSSEDLLGNAIVKMKTDLQQFRKDNEEKLWIHQGVEEVNKSLQGEKVMKNVTADSLHALASYLNCQVGLFYVAEGSVLHYMAGYAVPDFEKVPKKINIGETLVGEAALKKEIMQLTIPEDYIKISSGIGNSTPAQLLLLPLIYNNTVEGVLELASLTELDAKAMELLHQVLPVMGLFVRKTRNRMRLQELLEETQSQAEELQAQHTELENINSELENQTQRLQVSEEELRVQQEELMQANQELEERTRLLEEKNHQIAEQNIEIQKKAEELAISTKYKSEFLANMSHELRTPLNSILLLSRLLSENIEKNLSAEQIEYAKVIMSSGNGLLTLIDEILDLSKIEAGKMELDYQETPVESIVEDLSSLFQPVAKQKGLDFSIKVDASTPATIETDKLRLEQILKNLLSNALKFTSRGSVNMLINKPADQEHFITFSVKDSGIGIPADKQKLIFEAFQQADGSTRRKFGGTGLGLSISRELVKLLGGEIKVTSQPGKGSEFTIYVPVKKLEIEAKGQLFTEVDEEDYIDAEVKKPEVERERFIAPNIPENIPDDRDNISPHDKTILIIEDDVPFAKSLLDFTRSKKYKGIVAVRGDEGIELAKHFKPLGILLDLQLPVKDGWDVMDELKRTPETKHIPVHIMSSYEVKKESLHKGAIDFINKPVAYDQMQDVFSKIEKVVNQEYKKVLIVEENPKHAKALAYFLETFNINAEITNDSNKGVEALKKEDVNCVIMDMGIPDHHAYEMLEAIKKESGFEHLPVIIFTGKSLSKAEESRIRQYADTIVVKTAHSYQRILDEVSLFLHLVEEGREKEKNRLRFRKMGALQEVLSNKKVLVVDDDVRNIFSLTRMLESHNMKVVTAVDGKEALDQLEKNEDANAVLMDIMMPEMDGYETMKRIRKIPKFRHLPIIAVTAKAMTGDREKCIQAGASDYISKPVDMDQLLSLLRVWLYDKGI